jgi:hypothetical protein
LRTTFLIDERTGHETTNLIDVFDLKRLFIAGPLL